MLITTSQHIHKRGWQFDIEAIEQVIEELEIEMPVVLSIGPTKGEWKGQKYYYDAATHQVIKMVLPPFTETEVVTVHKITVNDTMVLPSKATEAIWHELAHAMQTERHVQNNGGEPLDFSKSYKRNNGNYYTNEYEIEARKIALQNSHKSLIKGIQQ